MDNTTFPTLAATPAADTTRHALLYVLHSGQMFGTERMAIATLRGLGPAYTSLMLAPDGPAIGHARTHGLQAASFGGALSLAWQMLRFFLRHRQVVLVATGVSHSLVGSLLAQLLGVRLRHLHVVHGGTDERLSYGRKKLLRWLAIDFVAVSAFVRRRLMAHGVPAARITVIENFLPETVSISRPAYQHGVQSLTVVSRLDPIKRIDLLLTAMASAAALAAMPATVYGSGGECAALQAQAEGAGLAVRFAGFDANMPQRLAESDLLVHTCPEEPFGLVILEAMLAGVAVLVPDAGGPGDFVCDGENGFVYRAGNAAHLAERLRQIAALPASELNRIAAAGRATLEQRFSVAARIADYRTLFEEQTA